MNGAVHNLLLTMSRKEGALFAGVNADVDEPDAIVQQAIGQGYVHLSRNSWATGDHYLLTRKGWAALGATPPPTWQEPATFRHILPLLAIMSAILIFRLLYLWLT